jgi:hypothetical protein
MKPQMSAKISAELPVMKVSPVCCFARWWCNALGITAALLPHRVYLDVQQE